MTAFLLVLLLAQDERTIVLGSSEHFVVHIHKNYITDHNRRRFEDHAREILEAAERVARSCFDQFGYKIPASLEDVFGPKSKGRKRVIRVIELGPGVYGTVVGEELNIALPDMFDRTKHSVLDSVAHEFFHFVQKGYDDSEDVWIYESTVVPMVDQVAPELAGKPGFGLTFYLHGWYHTNFHGLTYWDREKYDLTHPYGVGLFFQFLIERHGRDIIREIWENCGKKAGDNGIEAVDAALKGRGSALVEEWIRFSDAVVFETFDPKYAEAFKKEDIRTANGVLNADFPPIWAIKRDGGRAVLTPGGEMMEPLSFRYVRMRPRRAVLPGDMGAGVGNSQDLDFAFHILRKDGTWFKDSHQGVDKDRMTIQKHPFDDAEGLLVIVNTHKTESRPGGFVPLFHNPAAITSVTVMKSGETFYEARIREGRWDRKAPADPVVVRKGDTLEILVETNRPLERLSVDLPTTHHSLIEQRKGGWKWGVTIRYDDLEKELKNRRRLVLSFTGENDVGLGLDAEPLTEIRTKEEAATVVLEGYEDGPDQSHAVMLRLDEDASGASDCLCSEIEKPKGDFVAARMTGELVFTDKDGKVTERFTPAVGIKLKETTPSIRLGHDEKSGSFFLEVRKTLEEKYEMRVSASHPTTEERFMEEGRLYPRKLIRATTDPVPLYGRMWPSLWVLSPPFWSNLSLTGTVRGDDTSGLTAKPTGRMRLTAFGPSVVEGHFKAEFEHSWDEVDDKGKATTSLRGKGTIEICFHATLQRGFRLEVTGELNKRLDEQEKKEDAALKERVAKMEKADKAELEKDMKEVRRLGEEMKQKSKDAKEGKIPAADAIAAVTKFQEAAAAHEKKSKEMAAKRDETRKKGREEIRARRDEAEDAAWKGYCEKAPKEIKP